MDSYGGQEVANGKVLQGVALAGSCTSPGEDWKGAWERNTLTVIVTNS